MKSERREEKGRKHKMVKIWDGAVAKLKSACLECARSWV
jgi:hypothetical protein